MFITFFGSQGLAYLHEKNLMHRDIKVVLEFQRSVIAMMNKPNNIEHYSLSCRDQDYVNILKYSLSFVVNQVKLYSKCCVQYLTFYEVLCYWNLLKGIWSCFNATCILKNVLFRVQISCWRLKEALSLVSNILVSITIPRPVIH